MWVSGCKYRVIHTIYVFAASSLTNHIGACRIFRFDKSHPIATVSGSGKFIEISTKRYGDSTLVIQGGRYANSTCMAH